MKRLPVIGLLLGAVGIVGLWFDVRVLYGPALLLSTILHGIHWWKNG